LHVERCAGSNRSVRIVLKIILTELRGGRQKLGDHVGHGSCWRPRDASPYFVVALDSLIPARIRLSDTFALFRGFFVRLPLIPR
jgi:hypothetical protein